MDWSAHAETIEDYLRPNSFPIGIKLYEDREDLPEKARVPRQKVNICQLITTARTYQWVVASTADRMLCVLGADCAGLLSTPKRVEDGELNLGAYQGTEEAAREMQASMPKLDEQYDAIMVGPLSRIPDDPDVIVVYGMPAQVLRLAHAALYHRGTRLECGTNADAGICATGIAQTLLDDQPTWDLPCMGDLRFGLAQDHEIFFAYPKSWAERIEEGLEQTHKGGIRYPIPRQLDWTPNMPPAFEITREDLE